MSSLAETTRLSARAGGFGLSRLRFRRRRGGFSLARRLGAEDGLDLRALDQVRLGEGRGREVALALGGEAVEALLADRVGDELDRELARRLARADARADGEALSVIQSM